MTLCSQKLHEGFNDPKNDKCAEIQKPMTPEIATDETEVRNSKENTNFPKHAEKLSLSDFFPSMAKK